MFTIFINGIFFSLKDIRLGYYADNNTLSCNKYIETVISYLRHDFSISAADLPTSNKPNGEIFLKQAETGLKRRDFK